MAEQILAWRQAALDHLKDGDITLARELVAMAKGGEAVAINVADNPNFSPDRFVRCCTPDGWDPSNPLFC